MRTVTLGQILSPGQIVEVKRILNSTADSVEQTARLRDYYGTFRDDLERQEILPEYLAYVTVFAAASVKSENANKRKKNHETSKSKQPKAAKAAG